MTMEATLMAKKTFQNIMLIGRPGTPGVPETLAALKEYLNQQKVQVIVEKTTATLLNSGGLTVIDSDHIPQNCDLVVVVGGDGSLLNAAHIALKNNIPVLGINRGRLGFLTDIHPSDLTKVGDVLHGRYIEEKRFFLSMELSFEKKIIASDIALNDVVLLPGDIAQMIEFDTHINNQFMCSQRADGLIVASPTGSTAYALSGGGPIMHPKLDAIALVPMFPHTLSSRPVVIDANSKVEVFISKENDTSPYISCDGLSRVAAAPGARLEIKKHPQQLRLIHPEDYNYFTTLREKLGWENRAMRASS